MSRSACPAPALSVEVTVEHGALTIQAVHPALWRQRAGHCRRAAPGGVRSAALARRGSGLAEPHRWLRRPCPARDHPRVTRRPRPAGLTSPVRPAAAASCREAPPSRVRRPPAARAAAPAERPCALPPKLYRLFLASKRRRGAGGLTLELSAQRARPGRAACPASLRLPETRPRGDRTGRSALSGRAQTSRRSPQKFGDLALAGSESPKRSTSRCVMKAADAQAASGLGSAARSLLLWLKLLLPIGRFLLSPGKTAPAWPQPW